MKIENLKNINEIFSNKIRLGIMTILSMDEKVDFSTLKKKLEISDGNLGGHLSILEKKGYIKVEKKFVSRRPKTTYQLTGKGSEAFVSHLEQLELIIKNIK